MIVRKTSDSFVKFFDDGFDDLEVDTKGDIVR